MKKTKKRNYEYQINIKAEDYKDATAYDEWGAAFVWDKENPHIGAEYNIANNGTNCSAIYLMQWDNTHDNMETDYDTFVHYEIDWDDPEWKKNLRKAMWKAVKKWKEKCLYDVEEYETKLENKKVFQYSFDVVDVHNEDEMIEALEARGIPVLGAAWKATWDYVGYFKGAAPISSD